MSDLILSLFLKCLGNSLIQDFYANCQDILLHAQHIQATKIKSRFFKEQWEAWIIIITWMAYPSGFSLLCPAPKSVLTGTTGNHYM